MLRRIAKTPEQLFRFKQQLEDHKIHNFNKDRAGHLATVIRFNKRQYKLGEPVFGQLYLKNNTDDYIYCAPHKKWTKGLPERSDESPETARVEFDAPVQIFRGEQYIRGALEHGYTFLGSNGCVKDGLRDCAR